MSTYGQLLRDPRWQRRRLEVMQRDGFLCRECHSGTRSLNVHHINYTPGAAPWEYEDKDLRTFCEDCHARLEEDIRALRVVVAALSWGERRQLIGFARGLGFIRLGNRWARDVFPVGDGSVALGIEAALCHRQGATRLTLDASPYVPTAVMVAVAEEHNPARRPPAGGEPA